MSGLLGRQDCIESLRRDLVDLQGVVVDVFSRTGPVRFPSWKFPDKPSCNLDMVALLGKYDFVNGEDAFNQHSHIVLLELMIDRLLLLLQSFNAHIEQLQSCQKREQRQQRGSLSVGLVVRNYWSNLVQFASIKETFKDIRKVTNPKTSAHDETETVSSVSQQMSSRVDSCRHCLSTWSSTNSFTVSSQNHTPTSPTRNTLRHSEADSQAVGCQTIESCLIPCDACHRVQSALRKTGDALVELFQSEGLPSSLQPLSSAVEDTLELGHMTAGDVAQWANEQLRDMRRLAKHLQDVRSTVSPLKDRLAVAEREKERVRSQLEKAQKDFNQKMEKYQTTIVQLEFSLHKAQRSMKETEQRLLEEQHQLKTESLSLEENNSRLKEKVEVQQATLQTIECEKKALQEKVEALRSEEEVCCKLQQRIQQLEREISQTQVALDKEKAKYHSACRQQESMQVKQKSLLERVNALDRECEELQMQLGEREERQIELHNELQQMSEEKEQLQAQLAQQQDMHLELQKEKETLETNTGDLKKSVAELNEYVQAQKERERLLVAFPELSPLARAQPQSTGNVLLDMEQQLQANSIRIKVLEQENGTLHSSLEKLKERAQHNAARDAWVVQTTPVEKQQNHLTLMQSIPLQSSGAARHGYSNREKDARAGESGRESAESEDHVSTAAASPSSLQIHLQTLHLNTPHSAAAKNYSERRNVFLLSHSRGLNKRRK